jgi:hypothetical protein
MLDLIFILLIAIYFVFNLVSCWNFFFDFIAQNLINQDFVNLSGHEFGRLSRVVLDFFSSAFL